MGRGIWELVGWLAKCSLRWSGRRLDANQLRCCAWMLSWCVLVAPLSNAQAMSARADAGNASEMFVDEVAKSEAMARRCGSLPALARASDVERAAVVALARDALRSATDASRFNARALQNGSALSEPPLAVSAVLVDASALASNLSPYSAERLLMSSLLEHDPLADLLMREALLRRLAPTCVLDWEDVLRMLDASTAMADPRADRQRVRLYQSWKRSGVLDRGTFKRATDACETLRTEIEAWNSWNDRYTAWMCGLMEHAADDGCTELKAAILELRLRTRTRADLGSAKLNVARALRAWSATQNDHALLAESLRALLERGKIPPACDRIVSAAATSEFRFRLTTSPSGLAVEDFDAWLKLGGVVLKPDPDESDPRSDRERALDRRLHRLDHVERLERLPQANASALSDGIVCAALRVGASASSTGYPVRHGTRGLHSLSPPDDAFELWCGCARAVVRVNGGDRRMRGTRYRRGGAMCAGRGWHDNARGSRPC